MTRPIMSRLLRALFLTNDRNNQSRRRRHAIKPALENLEDRSTPSVVPHAIARPDWTDTDGNNPVRVHVLLNDSPSQATFGGKPVTLVPGSIAIVRGPAHGTLTVNRGKGTVTYKSDDPFTGNDSFLYTVKDSRGAISNIAAARVQVSRPTAADDWADTDATNPVTINVLDNDSDPDGNVYLQFPGSVSLRTGPAHGSVTLDQTTNSFTYQANGNFTGTDSFTYIVTNGSGAASAPGHVLVQVNRPTAANDLANFDGTTPVVIDVLENDSDPDGNQHIVASSVTVTTPPKHGTATVDISLGTIMYQANAGFTGTDTFKYAITDDAGAVSVPGTVTVVGTRPSKASDDETDTDGTNPVAVDVLANDIGVGGMIPGSVAVVAPPAHGTVSVNPANGQITYTANVNFGGTDSFRYSVRDAAGTTSTAMISVRVNRPVAADDWIDVDGTHEVTINVLDNDSDPDGNAHILFPGSVVRISSPTNGFLTFDSATNSFTYTANANFGGTDTFRYYVIDDAGAASMPANVFIRVNRPVAADDFGSTHGTSPTTIHVLINDSDPDGNEHIQYAGSVHEITNPLHGTVTFDAATNSFFYTAAAGFIGVDSFQYILIDDAGANSATPATVRVNVIGPTLVDGTVVITGPSSNTFSVANFARHKDGVAAVTGPITLVTGPQHGTLTIDQVHLLFTYTPNAGFVGNDTFTCTVTDVFGVSNTATITLVYPTKGIAL